MAGQFIPPFSAQMPRTPQHQFQSGQQPAFFHSPGGHQPINFEIQDRYQPANFHTPTQEQAPISQVSTVYSQVEKIRSDTSKNGNTNTLPKSPQFPLHMGNGQLNQFNATNNSHLRDFQQYNTIGNSQSQQSAQPFQSLPRMQSSVRQTTDPRFQGRPKATERQWMRNMIASTHPVTQQQVNTHNARVKANLTTTVPRTHPGPDFRTQESLYQYYGQRQAIQQPTAHQPTAYQPITHQPVTHQPVTHQPISQQPIAQQAGQQFRSRNPPTTNQFSQGVSPSQDFRQGPPSPPVRFSHRERYSEYITQLAKAQLDVGLAQKALRGSSIYNPIDLTADVPIQRIHAASVPFVNQEFDPANVTTPAKPLVDQELIPTTETTSAKLKSPSNSRSPTNEKSPLNPTSPPRSEAPSKAKKRKSAAVAVEDDSPTSEPEPKKAKTEDIKKRRDNNMRVITEQVQGHIRGQIRMKEKSWMITGREKLQADAKLNEEKLAADEATSRLTEIKKQPSKKKRRGAIANLNPIQTSGHLLTPPKEPSDYSDSSSPLLPIKVTEEEYVLDDIGVRETSRLEPDSTIENMGTLSKSTFALASIDTTASGTPTRKKRGRPSKKDAAKNVPRSPKSPKTTSKTTSKRGPGRHNKNKKPISSSISSTDDGLRREIEVDTMAELNPAPVADEATFDDQAFAAELEASFLADGEDATDDLEAELTAAFETEEAEEAEETVSEQNIESLFNSGGRRIYDSEGLNFGDQGYFGDEDGAFSDEDE